MWSKVLAHVKKNPYIINQKHVCIVNKVDADAHLIQDVSPLNFNWKKCGY